MHFLRERFSLLAITALLFLPLRLDSIAADAAPADAKFEELARGCIESFLTLKPEWATQLGDHRFDARLNDRSRAGVDVELALAEKTLKELAAISPAGLSTANRVDYAILKNNLESTIFEIKTVRAWEWNPLDYNIGNAIYLLLSRDYAPLPERLRHVKGRLEAIPATIAAAKANLGNPPKLHTETAALQNSGTVRLVREELNTFLEKAPAELKAELAPAQAAAAAALEDYGRWLRDELLPRSTRDFRLGDAQFRARLRYSLESDLSKEEVLRRAEEDLRKTQSEMYETACVVFKRVFPDRVLPENAPSDIQKMVCKAVLDQLAETRPDNDTIVERAKANLKQCTDFVRERRLVTVPDEPVQITVMPEFQRGVAVAYCDAPGVLGKNEATFYAISPTPTDWTPERKTSFYKEYNDFMLQELTIHEAMPGHYLQLTLANRFKAPTLVRGVWTSGIFAEGWACYAESFMAAAGYGGPEVKMQQLKMRLRLIINAILDQKIHTAGMTEREAMTLMINEGFQEEGEAAGKWRRAQLSAAQLSTYFVGVTEVDDIVRDFKAKHGGDKTDLLAMHDRMLTFGSVAPRNLRTLLGL